MSDRSQDFRLMSMRRLVPNILTVLALCAGLSAIQLATQERFEFAVLMIIAAAILDGLDGRIARLLNGDTEIGAELDSLSDFVAFGVAPGMVIFLWSLEMLKPGGWTIVLGYAICCALRLARFNVMSREEATESPLSERYFVGVPAPAGALLALLPMYLTFAGIAPIDKYPAATAMYLGIIAFLMVSRIPTFSFKKVLIRRDLIVPVLLAVALLATTMFTYTWVTLIALVGTYLVLIPLAIRSKSKERSASVRQNSAS